MPEETPGPASAVPLLSVEGLCVSVAGRTGPAEVVHGVSFTMARGETLGLVGESGSGKSLTALSMGRLLPASARIASGRVVFEGQDLVAAPEAALRRVRGARIGFVFQEPSSALNPVYSVGAQVAEALRAHLPITAAEAQDRAVDLLRDVAVPAPARRAREFPHQLSGGLRQRVTIAIALACGPALLVADEPTTALDATVQRDILDLLARERERRGLALLLITHDFGVVARMAQRVAVMYAGRIVEQAPARAVFTSPRHPYTKALLAAIPRGPRGSRLEAIDGAPPLAGVDGPGCAFAPRCGARFAACDVAPPPIDVGPEHAVRCHLAAPGA
jgi:oligopeptide/dipeptide ABC transporter ATP-binding protein